MDAAAEKLRVGGNRSLSGETLVAQHQTEGSEVAPAGTETVIPLNSRTSFATLAAGHPLIDRFSARYLREVGMYVYEDAAGEVRAAVSKPEQLPLINTVAWTLQRKVRRIRQSGRHYRGAGAHQWRCGRSGANQRIIGADRPH